MGRTTCIELDTERRRKTGIIYGREVCPLLSSPASGQLYIYMQHTMLHVYLHRESQPPFDGLYEDGGLYEDMHSLHQDQDDASYVR